MLAEAPKAEKANLVPNVSVTVWTGALYSMITRLLAVFRVMQKLSGLHDVRLDTQLSPRGQIGIGESKATLLSPFLMS
jgi:hypothetical protein